MADPERKRRASLRSDNRVVVRVWTVPGTEEIKHVSIEIPNRAYLAASAETKCFTADYSSQKGLPSQTICFYGLEPNYLISKYNELQKGERKSFKNPVSFAQASLEIAGIRCSLTEDDEDDPDLRSINPLWYLLFLRRPIYYKSIAAFPYGRYTLHFELTIKNLQQAKKIEIFTHPETENYLFQNPDYPDEKDWIPDPKAMTEFISLRLHPIKMGFWSSLLGGGAIYAGNVTQWAFLGGFSPVGFTLLVMIGLGFLVGGFIQISQEGLPCESTCGFRPCFQAPLSPKESSQQQPIQEQEETKLLLSSAPTSRNSLNTDLSIQ